jgi:hypothetical protein
MNEASKWRGADVIAPLRLRRAGEARNADCPFLVLYNRPINSRPTQLPTKPRFDKRLRSILCLNVTANAKNCVQTIK